VQPTEQPNQKNNRQWNAEKPKQQSASHDVYSYLALNKLNATTTSKLNRSDTIIARTCESFSRAARLKVVVDVISHQSAIGTTGTNHRSERCGPEKW